MLIIVENIQLSENRLIDEYSNSNIHQLNGFPKVTVNCCERSLHIVFGSTDLSITYC